MRSTLAKYDIPTLNEEELKEYEKRLLDEKNKVLVDLSDVKPEIADYLRERALKRLKGSR